MIIDNDLKSRFETLLANTKASYVNKTFNLNGINTALYIRVSTQEQALNGLSVQAQEAALLEFAEHKNLNVVGKYVDDGVSATTLKRAALLQLLDDVREGKIKFIIFTKIDRWSRKLFHYYKVQEILDEYGVQWKTIHEDYETFTANGQFQISIMLLCAELEAKRTSERIKTVMEYKVKNKQALGKAAFGYSINKDKQYIIHEANANFVKHIFDKYEKLQSIKAVVRYLKDIGSPFSEKRLRYLLRNTAYIGIYEHEQYGRYDDYYPPIITTEQFERVQRLLDSNISSTIAPNTIESIFRKLIVCSECGCKMTGKRRKQKCRDTILYRCNNHNRQTCSNKANLPQHKLEDIIFELLPKELHKLKIEFNDVKKSQPKIDRKKLEKRIEIAKEAWLDGEISKQEYHQRKAKLEAQLYTSIDDNITKVMKLENMITNNFREVYDTLDTLEKRALIASVCKEIKYNVETKSYELTLL